MGGGARGFRPEITAKMGESGVKERLFAALESAGAVAAGVAHAVPTDEKENARIRQWISSGMHAGMVWMERHAVWRRDLNNVLPGTRSIICAAFPYSPAESRASGLPYISRYAYGEDYHEAIRSRLRAILSEMGLDTVCRVCIDSAPVSERFWAIQSGIGYKGDNGSLIVPDYGPEVFLAEILTTLELEPDTPNTSQCLHCGSCRRACPTGALQQDGTVDCRRCISYLTIEHRGVWSDPEAEAAMSTPAGKNTLFGCDRCVTACPLRNGKKGLAPLPLILSLTPEDIPRTNAEFKSLFRHTALLRPGLEGLKRNIANLDKNC